jgi:hypothetical protein
LLHAGKSEKAQRRRWMTNERPAMFFYRHSFFREGVNGQLAIVNKQPATAGVMRAALACVFTNL